MFPIFLFNYLHFCLYVYFAVLSSHLDLLSLVIYSYLFLPYFELKIVPPFIFAPGIFFSAFESTENVFS